jgi:GDP-6-deoxy-D-talose 4-dehydrogenase
MHGPLSPGSSRRVLLTGARGFTGIHLRRELEAAHYRVMGLVNDRTLGTRDYVANLTDAAATRQAVLSAEPDYVVHLAGIPYVAHRSVEELYQVNVLGTVNLLQAVSALPRRPRRVVLASSANVYGNTDSSAVDEACPVAPVHHYAATKVALEAVAAVFRGRFPIVLTRPFNYTGPGQASHFLVPKLVDHFARRAPRIELGNLDLERDFLDVRTVVAIYRKLLDCDGEDFMVVNVCSGRGILLHDIVVRLQRITGHTASIHRNERFMRGPEARRLVGSNQRLTALIGALPDVPFDQTLRDMLAKTLPVG